MKKTKLKIIVKMRKIDNFKYNYDDDYNDDEYEDIGKVRQMKIGQEDEENETKVQMNITFFILISVLV